MKLQKNTLFALYSVLESASRPEQQLSAAEIARRHRISPHHLAKVLHTLARAGVVESVRGVGGGYRFAGNAHRLTLMDVISRFEDILPADNDIAENTPVGQALASVLSEIDEIAKASMRSITVATMQRMIKRQQRAVAKTEPKR